MVEQAFIDAINANPGDLTLQLVYADWLDEQGDPRGKAWRVLIEERHWPMRKKHGGWWWPHEKSGLGYYYETFFEAMESAISLYVHFFSADETPKREK